MKSKWTKLATAAAVIVAAMLTMYAITGSVDGTSITIAQVKQAMDKVDWMQIVITSRGKEGEQVDWYSFASKVHIAIAPGIGISYSDFNARTDLFWRDKGEHIYESPIETKRFANDAGGPFEMIDMSLRLVEAQEGADVVKEPGTFDGREVEVWTATHVKRGSARTITVYMDVDSNRPIAATYRRAGTDSVDAEDNTIRFNYPETGPADIYAAGAPASATIKPAQNQ